MKLQTRISLPPRASMSRISKLHDPSLGILLNSAWILIGASFFWAPIQASDKALLPKTSSQVKTVALDAVRSAFGEFLEALDTVDRKIQDVQKTSLSQLPKTLTTLSPWATPMSPIEPIQIQSFNYWNGRPTGTPTPKNLSAAIPTPYHWAEHLGLGTNSVHLEARHIDGQLFTSIEYGFNIAQRLRYDIVGTFHLNDREGTLETFRSSIESLTRVNTREINIGPEVKPHKVGFAWRDDEDEPRREIGSTPWYLERLDRRFPKDFRSIEPTPEENKSIHPIRELVLNRIEARLDEHRFRLIDRQHSKLKRSEVFSRLETARLKIVSWESGHGHEQDCQKTMRANQLLSRESILRAIERQSATKRPWRLSPSLRSEQREAALGAVLHGLLHRLEETPQEELRKLLQELTLFQIKSP